MISLLQGLINRLDLVRLSVRLRLPVLTALFTYILTERINTGGKANVLCIGRPIFDEDIRALAEYAGKLSYVRVPKAIFIKIFGCFAPELMREHAAYHKIHEFDEHKERYRRYLKKVFSIYEKMLEISCVVTANYNYSWQQELATVFKEKRTPFVVLFKEGISPLFSDPKNPISGYEQLVRSYTNDNFLGDLMLVYNKRIKTAFDSVGIKGLPEKRVVPVGIPRFDRYFKLKAEGELLVFFSFNFGDKARHLGLSDEIYAEYLRKTDEFHQEVIKYAMSHPDQKVLIKTKNNTKYLTYVVDLADDLGAKGLPNLTITNTGKVYELLSRARAVIGYNSTTLLEAYAAQRVVMSADFRWGVVRDSFEEHPELPNYVTNQEDIENVMKSGLGGVSLDNPDLVGMLYERIHTPDGMASRRTESAIQDIIKHGAASGQ